jgi:RimJ/RimL family protein N-acetyltransferase
MELKLVKNEEKYFEFIRNLRNDKENQKGFLEQVSITKEQQKNYMSKYGDDYYICLKENIPVGYIGVVDNDIRVCTDTKYKKTGSGTFMLNEVMKIYPNATAKILKDNLASLNLFKKCNFVIVNSDENLYYLKYEL